MILHISSSTILCAKHADSRTRNMQNHDNRSLAVMVLHISSPTILCAKHADSRTRNMQNHDNRSELSWFCIFLVRLFCVQNMLKVGLEICKTMTIEAYPSWFCIFLVRLFCVQNMLIVGLEICKTMTIEAS